MKNNDAAAAIGIIGAIIKRLRRYRAMYLKWANDIIWGKRR